MKSIWFLWVMFCLGVKTFSSEISYDPHQIYYQGKIYRGVEFVGIEVHEERYLEISKRMNPDLLDYATGMIWPQMPIFQRQQFLEDLHILDEKQTEILASFEAENMFPETMHPLNRIKVVQRVKLWGCDQVFPHLSEIIYSHTLISKEKEAYFAQILRIDDFSPQSNGFLESLTAGLDEPDYRVVIDAFQKAKLLNMRAGLCALSLIDLMMPVLQRVEILDKISRFSDGENAVLLNTNFTTSFQDMSCDEKIRLLKELSTHTKLMVDEKIRHIASERNVLKGRVKRKKITLAPIEKL